MPAKIKVKIICARNLPVMDRSSESSDAFVEVRFGANHHDKTHVFKKSLDPEWNSRFIFEVEDDEIQEEPLQIRVLDHDTYSSHDAIGKVYIDLKPLVNTNGPSAINGWFPIYDTMHGIRIEIKVECKVEIFNDFNEYRKSSCGVQFFCSNKVPDGYLLHNFCGFVEEQVINDDPEYQWIDKIRTPRTSNETRQKLFSKLSGEVQRRIGLKALDMGGNCVVGYIQNFDLEGEHGIVVRGIGTVAYIYKNTINATTKTKEDKKNTNGLNNDQFKTKLSHITRNHLARIHSDSDLNNYHLKHQIAQISQTNENVTHKNPNTSNANEVKQSILDKQEYPFLTIQQFPIGFVKSICGIVCARSVKLLSSMSSEQELDARDKWWLEIRNEIRSHMKALSCHIVLGYVETKSIYEDVCVLSASGTAALIDETFFINVENRCYESEHSTQFSDITNKNCKLCHVPYNENDLPFPISLTQCCICSSGLVPDIIISSIQPLPELETIGQGTLLRAVVSRPHKKCNGEISAKIISDYLPFMEYELHRQLLGKLKLKGMNMLYGLRVQISIGENLLTGLAEATACKVAALPGNIILKIFSEKSGDKTNTELEEIEKLNKMFNDKMNENKIFFNLNSSPKSIINLSINPKTLLTKDTELNNEQQKGLFKIELDDVREKDEIYLLFDNNFKKKKGFYLCSTEYMPGIPHLIENIQMFTSVYRCETALIQMSSTKYNEIYDEILKSLQFKFRKYSNCCLANLSFDNSLYDDDHAMIIITGSCLTFSVDKTKVINHTRNKGVEITNLSYVPNTRIENYFGNINLFIIRESTQIKENGGLSGFMHCFISEVLALTRAHVLSLGGNALVSFKMNECVLLDNPHRNQGQCLINVFGDAVQVKQI